MNSEGTYILSVIWYRSVWCSSVCVGEGGEASGE